MTKIVTRFPDTKDVNKVLSRFYEVADSREIPRETALIEALWRWVNSDFTI
jgi:hypothetical protein